MTELSQSDFFALLGILIFLIAIGLILPTFIVKDHRKKLRKNSWLLSETTSQKDSILGAEEHN